MNLSDLSRIDQIYKEHPCLTLHDAALISVENQLYRIAEAVTAQKQEPSPEAEVQLNPLEQAAVDALLKEIAEIEKKNNVGWT